MRTADGSSSKPSARADPDAAAGAGSATSRAQWSTWRYRDAAAALGRLANPGASLVDIGCGRGNTLAYLAGHAPLGRVLAVDPDRSGLEATRRQVACETLQASILEPAPLAPHAGGFDFAVLGDVLHHLVGPSRRASLELARRGAVNAAALLRPGGVLFVLEPTFRPRALAAAVFHLKRVSERLTSGRLELGWHWANLGPPLVSLFDQERLVALARSLPGLELEAVIARPSSPPWAPVRRGRVTLLLRRPRGTTPESER